MNADLEWADLQLLGLLAQAGTLSAAGRMLGIDQTTASRRLARIEHRLGSPLFDRIEGRLRPTPLLSAALAPLVQMAEVAGTAQAALNRSKVELAGRVRVSSLGFFLRHVLAPAMGAFHEAHPGIALDLGADDRSISIEQREADIAVRFAMPRDDVALMRRLGSVQFALYAPANANQTGSIVAYDESLAHLPEMQALQQLRPNAPIVLRANRLDILSEVALATGASLMLPDIMVAGDPRFVRQAPAASPVQRDIFMLVHPARRHAPSVDAVCRWIEDATRGLR
ncbi:MAG: LysR family transcriptional regulator [Bosea sp. (in: a-proteobacteria)]